MLWLIYIVTIDLSKMFSSINFPCYKYIAEYRTIGHNNGVWLVFEHHTPDITSADTVKLLAFLLQFVYVYTVLKQGCMDLCSIELWPSYIVTFDLSYWESASVLSSCQDRWSLEGSDSYSIVIVDCLSAMLLWKKILWSNLE